MSGLDTPTPRMRRVAPLWLLLIVVAGFGLRLAGWWWGQGYIYFGQGDAVEAYKVATEWGLGEPRALYLGQPNYNSHAKLPGPLWSVFCLVCCRGYGSIEGAALGVVLLSTAAIYLTYLLAERTISPSAGQWAALLTATAPWAVYYSVSVYNPEVMSFLGGLFFLVLWHVTNGNRAKAIFWIPVLLAAMLQFHMSGLMLIPAAALILWLCPARLHIPWLLGGTLAALALYLPYLRGEAMNDWQNTQGILVGGGAGNHSARLKALSAPLSFLVNWAPRWTQSAAEYRSLGKACFGWFPVFLGINLLSAGVAVFMVAGAFAEIRKCARKFWAAPRAAWERAPGMLFLAILFIVPLLTALAFGNEFHTRYCLVLLPVMLSLAAAGILHWLGPWRWRPVFLFGLIGTVCANIWLMPAMYWSQGARIDKGPVFIPSFRKLETVYQCLKSHAGAGSAIQIDDIAYVYDETLMQRVRADAFQLGAYVNVREKEAMAAKSPRGRRVTYRLVPEAQAKAGDLALGYRGNGIALIAVGTEDR